MSSRQVRLGTPRVSLSQSLLRRWHNGVGGLTLDFTDLSACVIDPTTIRNNFFGSVNSLLSITTSPKWILNSSGVYVQTSANTLATEYDAAGNALGVRIEEARTNSIRNSTMVGASAPSTLPTNWAVGTASGLTTTVIGTGTQNGVSYIDLRISGTSSGTDFRFTMESTTAVTAANGQTWTESAFISVVGGSKTNITSLIFNMIQRTAAGATVAGKTSSSILSSLGATQTRFAHTATLDGGGTVERLTPEIQFLFSSGVAIDITLRIGWPQLEQGAFATSPIPTTSAAVTRAADNVSLATSLFPAGSSRTLYVDGFASGSNPSAPAYAAALDDGSTSNLAYIGRDQNLVTGRAVVITGGTEVFNATPGSFTNGAPFRACARLSANNFALSMDGVAVVTDPSGGLPTVTALRLGNRADLTRAWNSHLKRVVLLPVGLPDAQIPLVGA